MMRKPAGNISRRVPALPIYRKEVISMKKKLPALLLPLLLSWPVAARPIPGIPVAVHPRRRNRKLRPIRRRNPFTLSGWRR